MELIPLAFAQEHLASVLAIESLSHATPWSEGMLRSEMTNGISYFRVFVEQASGSLAGYGGFWNMVGDGNITNVTVSPDWRRRGVGRLIVQHLLEAMRGFKMEYASLEVRQSNLAAIRLYQACGFSLLGTRPKYYGDGETALIFGRLLNDSTRADLGDLS
jgi:ribosomal-protein-alanine N-acetyltransferase